MRAIRHYLEALVQEGRYHFTTEEVSTALGREGFAIKQALLRLRARGAIATPQRGFHLVVPPEYRSLGCLPAEQFVPQLMEHLGKPYHVALLSAAQLHGAAHQRPQRFQVMVKSPRKPIRCGSVHVDFHIRNNLGQVATVIVNTPRGYLSVASPEATALELVGYQQHAGGLENVATVLAELAELLSPSALAEQAKIVPLAWVQRLGFLLELVEQSEVAGQLLALVQSRARRITPLDPAITRTGAPRSPRWKIALNAVVEPEL